MIYNVGPHKLQHGDILNGIDDLMAGEKADVIYTDPPWGVGNLKYWQTINKKMNGTEPKEVDYNGFLEAIFSTIQKYAKNKVVIDYGVKWKDDIINYGRAKGLTHHGVATAYYDGKKMRPSHIHFFTVNPNDKIIITPKLVSDLEASNGNDLNGIQSIFDFINPTPGELCLDPCSGVGLTAQAAKDHGMRFNGNELNFARLKKSQDRLLGSAGDR